MKKQLHYFLLIFSILTIAASCKKDDAAVEKNHEDSKLIQSAIAGVNGPTTGLVNQELVFNIVWQNTDGAARFKYLQDSTAHNARFIKLFALSNAVDTAKKDTSAVAYKFKAKTSGTYYLKFYKADNSDKTAIIDTINIK